MIYTKKWIFISWDHINYPSLNDQTFGNNDDFDNENQRKHNEDEKSSGDLDDNLSISHTNYVHQAHICCREPFEFKIVKEVEFLKKKRANEWEKVRLFYSYRASSWYISLKTKPSNKDWP